MRVSSLNTEQWMPGTSPRTVRERAAATEHGLRLDVVPPATRGGTWFYCPYIVKRTGSHGWSTTSCGITRPGRATGTRFRTEAAYRRHWRSCHGAQESAPRGLSPVLETRDELAQFAPGPGLLRPCTEQELKSEAMLAQVNEGLQKRVQQEKDKANLANVTSRAMAQLMQKMGPRGGRTAQRSGRRGRG